MRTMVGAKVQSTSTLVSVKNGTVGAKNNVRKVQSTSKLVGAKNKHCTATSNHMKLT
jgi:hypothetical protein